MIRRNIEASVRSALADTPVVLLTGARQTGKTTLARALADDRGAEYFTLDDATTLSLCAADPSGFIGNLSGDVVLDEIQRSPDLLSAIKLAVDQDRRPGRFLLTGSANVLTVPRVSESLAGRMEIIPLYPFSVGELMGISEGFAKRIFAPAFVPSPASVNHADVAGRIARGGYPEATQRGSDERRAAWFASYVSAILQRDVRDLARVEALHALPNLLKLLAARSSGLLNLADVGRDAGLPHTTLTRYLTLLETVFLVQRLPAWSRNLGQRMIKASKLHLIDTGLACHLVGANATRLTDDRSLLGRMLESFIVGELRKQLSWDEPRTALFHYRTAAGAEVDLLLERPDGTVAAVEVKATATVTASDFTALQSLRDQLGPQFRAGVVLYLGERAVPFGDRLWLAPVSTVWSV